MSGCLSLYVVTRVSEIHSRVEPTSRLCLAWMPDELSPAHNIVCSGSSVWHRSVEEKLCLVWKPTRPIKLSWRGFIRCWTDPPCGAPGPRAGAPGPGRERGSRAGQRAGLPGRAGLWMDGGVWTLAGRQSTGRKLTQTNSTQKYYIELE